MGITASEKPNIRPVVLAEMSVARAMRAPVLATQWTPSQLGNHRFWVDATQESYNNNDPVDSLTDRLSTSLDFSNTGSARPTFKTGIQNSQPAILFDGTDDVLRSANTTDLNDVDDDYTLWAAFQITSNGSRAIFHKGDGASNAGSSLELVNWPGNNLIYSQYSVGSSGNVIGDAEHTSWAYYVVKRNGAAHILRRDGAIAAEGELSGTINDCSRKPSIGALSPGTFWHAGYIGEVGLVAESISDVNLAKLERYLSAKWGIS